MLYLEFTKILEAGIEFQKCKRRGRYFIVKGNYHGACCDRITKGESRTCQQLAAQETYLNKLGDNDGKNARASTRNTTNGTLPGSRPGPSSGTNSNGDSIRRAKSGMPVWQENCLWRN